MKLTELTQEIITRLLAIEDQSLPVRAAINKAILLNNALTQVNEPEPVVEEKPTKNKRKKRASKSKK